MKSTSLLPMLAAFFLAAVAVCPPAALGVQPPSHEALPNYDKRKAKAEQALPASRAARLAELRERVPGLQIDFDEVCGTPKRVSSTTGFLSGPDGQGKGISPLAVRALAADDPHRPLKAFLNEHAALFGHGAEILNSARVKREFVTPHNGLRTIVHEQHLDEIPVYEGLLAAHITQRGELVNLSSQFLPNLAQAANAGTPNRAALEAAPPISAVEAIRLAANEVGEDLAAQEIVPVAAAPDGAEKRQKFKAGLLPAEAQVKLLWLPVDASTVRLCWQVELTRRVGGERFRVLVDAQNGEAMLRRCLTVYLTDATYRVFTNDSPAPLLPGYATPTTNQAPLVPRGLVTLSALFTNASPLGWIGDGDNETRGNNVDAHLDLNGDDLPDLPRPHGSPFRVFDFPLDLSQAPSAYRDAAVVQLFYWCNWMHDQLYQLGFTEAAGNFQNDNLGRGGAGNDAVQADAQDGSGSNNANFSSTDDGDSPRLQMFLFNGPIPARDGDLDATIILHEYTHGLSTRLVGAGAGISAVQTEGMGEGWSDFYAITLLSQPGGDVNGNYEEGGYITYQFYGLNQNYYYGIRSYPYTTDLTKNPLTFKDIDPYQTSPHTGVPISPVFGFNALNAGEVHHQGEVWCVTLWEARARLIQKYGFARGTQLILQLVTDGMKLGPPNPNFLQARDAIIQADFVDNGGLDYDDLWRAFAKRGMGFSATSPSSTTTIGVHEAFDLPDALLIVPSTPFFSGGRVGGPLIPSCMTYLLTNHTSNAFSWTAKATDPWLVVTPASGTIAAGKATNVTICLTNGGNNLPLGNYAGAVLFTNLTSHVGQRRDVHVRVMDFAPMPFVEDFESGSFKSYWLVTGTGPFRSQVTTNDGPHGGRFHLTMDSQGSGNSARNEVNLGLDLGGYTNVTLRFWAKSFGDEPDGPPPSPFLEGADFDGVAISQDGFTWYEARGLRDLQSTNTQLAVDLDAAIAAHGLAYSSTFRIRFNQYDDFSIPTDGIALDDISVTGLAARRLVVSVPKQATEGDGTLAKQGRVTLAVPVAAALTVTLASSDTSKVRVPATVTIPAGATAAAFDILVQNNSVVDGSQTAIISAAATGYFGQSDFITVRDNERAMLKLKLPASAREGDGILTNAATITVNASPVRDVLVSLFSSDTNEVQVPATAVMAAGKKSAAFDLIIVDDHKIDGTRSATITAHVDNWADGQATMSVLDNESPGLSLVLPARASEGNGLLPKAGVVRLPGTLGTNLIVFLISSNTSKVLVPASVVIPAGSDSAAFDLTMVDNAVIDGLRTVTLSARATGFGVAVATIGVLDDETPPVPYGPAPLHLSAGLPLTTDLAWHGGVGEIIVNGGFETGDFTGWRQVDLDYGTFVMNDGTFDPDGGEGPLPPYDGGFSAMTAQIGGGSHTLYQDVLIPSDSASATLSWVDQIRNHGTGFAPGRQEFRVEIRNPNNDVLAVAFATKPGDPATNGWTKRSFDLTSYRGQTVRIAFVELDHLGYFNLHVDDVSVILGAPGVTSFDVFFGTNTIPGPAQLLGNTTNQSWSLPNLALKTTYYWRVVSKRGTAQTGGPVWQFTTRGVGAIDHFEWGVIPGTEFVDQPFPVTLSAKDDINNTITNYNGSVAISALPGAGTVSAIVITEIDTGNFDKVEFANVSDLALDISGWQISGYDSRSWPAPRSTFVVPTNTLCGTGDVFSLNYSIAAVGSYPNFYAGTNIFWLNTASGNPVAVLLRDAAGNLVDFVCAVDANPGEITDPITIPREEWVGSPIPANTNTSLTYQRAGHTDHNGNSDWATATSTFGKLNPGLMLPFQPQNPISFAPTNVTDFSGGVWAGHVVVHQTIPSLLLRATDGRGHFGQANQFAVGALNDVSVTVSNYPGSAIVGDQLNYLFTITNTGPLPAALVLLQDALPPGATFVSATASRGVCASVGGTVFCNLGAMAGGESITVALVLSADTVGVLTNVAAISRPEADGYAPNNTATTVTPVSWPLLSVLAAPGFFEGNSGMTNAVFPVRLSTPSRLPVSVHFATSDDTTTAGDDYIPASGTLVFPPGSVTQTVVVKVIGDTVYEAFESFFLNLSSPTNAAIGIAQGRARIFNDDPLPKVFISDATVLESPPGTTTNAVFTVSLAGLTSFPASLAFATQDGTALAGVDYVAQSGVVNFPLGVTNQTISVVINGNTIARTNATFSILLGSVTNAALGNSHGVCTILDNGASQLRVIGAAFEGGNVRLSFIALQGKRYRLEWTEDLSGNVWTPVGNDLVGAGTTAQLSDTAEPGRPQRFYRIRLVE